ncbi:MAG TPA: glycosyltransferase [Thermoanaerobaculia bacterium]|nr:glycosyltransferase [Thermoanaerobaculia bacterium]
MSRVALIGWGNCFEEDFLETIGVSIEEFCDSLRGSWAFGYAEALASAGIEMVSFYFSARISSARRYVHRPTSTVVWLLPAPRRYRLLRRMSRRFQRLFPGHGEALNRFMLVSEYAATPLWELRKRLRQEGCDAMLVQGYDCPRFDLSVLLGRAMRLPVFGTYQAAGDFRPSRLQWFVRRCSLSLSAGLIIAPDREVGRLQLRYRFPSDRVGRIVNPVDTQFWHRVDAAQARARLRLPLDSIVVVWHGRVDFAQKGLDVLLEAWDIVTSEAHDMARQPLLVLMGTGPDSDVRMKPILSTRKSSVYWIDRFIHEREYIRDLLSAGDLYAFPSRLEGQAIAPVEAMACSLPILTSRSGFDLDDLISADESFAPEPIESFDARAWADRLLELIRDRDLRDCLGKRARQFAVEHFSLPGVGLELASFLSGSDDGFRRGRTVRLQPLVIKSVSPSRIRRPVHGCADVSVSCEHATSGTYVLFDGHVLLTTYGTASLLTATVHRALLRQPGVHEIRLTDGQRLSAAVEIEIEPSSRMSRRKVPVIMSLQPDHVVAGAPFNRQPDGSSALVIHCRNASCNTRVLIDDQPTVTSYGSESLLTALVPPAIHNESSRHLVHLVGENGSSNAVEFTVLAQPASGVSAPW